jgi:sulfite exporter TauE/SafE
MKSGRGSKATIQLFDSDLELANIMNSFRMVSFRMVSFIACSLGLSATSQRYFSLRTNQQPASSTVLSEQTSH